MLPSVSLHVCLFTALSTLAVLSEVGLATRTPLEGRGGHVQVPPEGGKGKLVKVGLHDPNIVNPDTDVPERPPQFDLGMIEGDIIPDRRRADNVMRSATRQLMWPKGIVPYVIDDGMKKKMREKVDAAFADFHEFTCVKFQPWKSEKDYVHISSKSSGCNAAIGRHGGKQPVNLASPGCAGKGTVIHELLHTIGFAHEQARTDRDKYVNIHWDNILISLQSQFTKLSRKEAKPLGTKYDFSSIMHYPDYAFSWGGKKSITTKDKSKQDLIGQRQGFSKVDIEEVNKLYKCDGKTSKFTGEEDEDDDDETQNAGGGGTPNPDCKDKNANFCENYVKSSGSGMCNRGGSNIGDMCPKSCDLC